MPKTKVRGKPARRRTPSPKSTRKTRLPRGRSKSRSTRRQRSRTRSLSPNFKVPDLKKYLKLVKSGDPATLSVMKAFRGNRGQRGGNLMDGMKNVFSSKFNNQKLLGNASVSSVGAGGEMGTNSSETSFEGGRRRRKFSRRFGSRLSRRRNTNRKGGRRRMKGGAGSTHSGYSLGGELPGGLSALANPSSPVGYNDCKINTYNHFTGESS